MVNISNYTIYHLHSDLSNGVTNIDSVTKYESYVECAKAQGMKALAFSEHGSLFEWWHKKCAIEDAGMKYIHAVEAYLTETLTEKVRDNYHCVLIAKNYEGFLELNKLVTNSFTRTDNHFYYVPRISMEEIFKTSDNIIITTACVGGVFGKGDAKLQSEFLDFLRTNKHRCFLEIGHHLDEKQIVYNKRLLELSKESGVPLIAGTDTHVLDEMHEKGRSILQLSKNINFGEEEKWDLKFKTYDELVSSYKIQDSLPEKAYIEAIENTNLLADMVSEFQIDRSTKYPKIYEDPKKVFREKTELAIKTHPYATKNHSVEELTGVVDEEFEVYTKTQSIDFMLLQTYLREWEQENNIQCGYGRGSVSGSMMAYLLRITEMDSMRFGLNFFRFMNPSRVTNADIDTDYSGADREKVKRFLLQDKMNLPHVNSAEIITFNTIALKGAIRDVCRALYKDSPSVKHIELATKIIEEAEANEEKARRNYPDVFSYVDIVNGTIVSIGTHPSGVLISDLPIDETVGLCTISTSPYPVSMINMKELDNLMYVKLDILGLDNIGVINETCKSAGIPRLTPDNVDLEDEAVWRSIRDDTTLIFQWESNSAQAYLKKFMSDRTIEIAKQNVKDFSYIKWLSFGNGLIRPGCASFRDDIANGCVSYTGFKEFDEAFSKTFGRITMQEDIMQFCKKFCGYTDAESDNVRRGIAKKKGTAGFVKEIHERFVEYSSKEYGVSKDKLEEMFPPIEKGILDASDYAFSWNHSDAYSCIGYISGYLRYYYPYEFITAALNVFNDNSEKTAEIVAYATKRGIKVTMPRWGISKGEYVYNKDKEIITKGVTSIKYMSAGLADELYELSQGKRYTKFVDVLYALEGTSIDTRQFDILVKLDYFSEFGNQRELLRISEIFYDLFSSGNAKKISRSKVDGTPLEPIVQKYSVGTTKAGGIAKSYTLLDNHSILDECERAIKAVGMQDLDDLVKIQNFKDIMGYLGYITDKAEDRRKLYVTDIKPLHKKKDGKQFGYSVFTKSIGSGKESRFTVFNRHYNKDPFGKGEIIHCLDFERDGAYYILTKYTRL